MIRSHPCFPRLTPFAARALALAGALLLAAAPARAQSTGAVEMVVIDAETGGPLAGASVRVDGEPRGVSDAGGYVAVEGLAPGPHEVVVEMMGRSSVQPRVELAAGQVFGLEVLMEPAAIPIPPITARAPPESALGDAVSREAARTHGTGIFISREQIRRSRAERVSDLLGKVPGVRVVYGFGGAMATFPGGGPDGAAAAAAGPGGRCTAQVYLDGVVLRNPGLDAVSVHDLESVEIYPHIVPAAYGGLTAGCGVIVLHIRTR